MESSIIASRDNPAPDTMGQTFDVLADLDIIPPQLAGRMKKAVGFRNIPAEICEDCGEYYLDEATAQRVYTDAEASF
jgi:hypothetical protein